MKKAKRVLGLFMALAIVVGSTAVAASAADFQPVSKSLISENAVVFQETEEDAVPTKEALPLPADCVSVIKANADELVEEVTKEEADLAMKDTLPDVALKAETFSRIRKPKDYRLTGKASFVYMYDDQNGFPRQFGKKQIDKTYLKRNTTKMAVPDVPDYGEYSLFGWFPNKELGTGSISRGDYVDLPASDSVFCAVYEKPYHVSFTVKHGRRTYKSATINTEVLRSAYDFETLYAHEFTIPSVTYKDGKSMISYWVDTQTGRKYYPGSKLLVDHDVDLVAESNRVVWFLSNVIMGSYAGKWRTNRKSEPNGNVSLSVKTACTKTDLMYMNEVNNDVLRFDGKTLRIAEKYGSASYTVFYIKSGNPLINGSISLSDGAYIFKITAPEGENVEIDVYMTYNPDILWELKKSTYKDNKDFKKIYSAPNGMIMEEVEIFFAPAGNNDAAPVDMGVVSQTIAEPLDTSDVTFLRRNAQIQ